MKIKDIKNVKSKDLFCALFLTEIGESFPNDEKLPTFCNNKNEIFLKYLGILRQQNKGLVGGPTSLKFYMKNI